MDGPAGRARCLATNKKERNKGKTGIAIISLVVGLGVGAWGGLNLGGGAMMGVGVATGLSSGICATVQAAQEEGLLTAEPVDQVLNRAAQDISGKAELAETCALLVATSCGTEVDMQVVARTLSRLFPEDPSNVEVALM